MATIERASVLVTRWMEQDDSLAQLGLVVVDELHTLGEGRGPHLELMLNKLRWVVDNTWLFLMPILLVAAVKVEVCIQSFRLGSRHTDESEAQQMVLMCVRGCMLQRAVYCMYVLLLQVCW